MSRSLPRSLATLIWCVGPLSVAGTFLACQPSREPVPVGPSAGDEVSVGYATADRRVMSMSVSSLDETDIDRMEVGRVEELLRRVSGVHVARLPNGDYSIRIRGAAASTSNNEPLVVIDGVTSGTRGLWRVTPRDVERIDVLKGPAATIYGLRGANGVIVITTRRGQ